MHFSRPSRFPTTVWHPGILTSMFAGVLCARHQLAYTVYLHYLGKETNGKSSNSPQISQWMNLPTTVFIPSELLGDAFS